jgi:photosystem II stability/assembly factor-like uncharacterized protein
MKKIILILFIQCSLHFVYSQSGWYPLNSGVTYDLTVILFTDSLTGYCAGYSVIGGGAILKTSNGGVNWFIQILSGHQMQFDAIFFTGHDTGYAGCDMSYIYKTTNGGANWFVQSSNMGRVWTIYFVDQNTGFTGGKYGQQRKTTDGGNNWINITNGGGSNYTSFYFTDANTGFAATEGEGILRTTNGAVFWDTAYSAAVQLWTLFFTSANTGFAGGRRVTSSYLPIVLKTTNAGLNWSSQLLPTGYCVNSIFFYNQNTGYAACYYPYIFKTTDEGNNWVMQSIATNFNLNSLYFTSSSTGYVCGENGLILKTTTGGEPIGIKPISNSVPSKFILFQNYPNPFNPTTKIKFDIASVGQRHAFDVQLVIYDLLGREVATLINKQLKPGTYKVEWDGTNYPSGVYFYKLNAGEFIETKKMVLIK